MEKIMINLIGAELYKLKKSMSYKVALILAVVFSMITYFVYAVFQSGFVDISGGTNAVIMESLSNSDILDILRQMFANTNTLIFVTIFLCLFAIGDYRSGAIKNFVGKGVRREKLYFARFLIAELGAVTIYLLTAAVVLVGGIFCYGSETINGTFFHDFIVYLTIHLIYLVSYTAIILLICEITRNVAGILLSILGILMLSSPILSVIDLLINTLGIQLEISDYWIMSLITSCPVNDIPTQFIIRSVIVAGVWMIVTLTGGILCHRWRDIA